MTAIPAPLTPAHADAHAGHGPTAGHGAAGHGHADHGHQLSFIKKYLFSTDHKVIGIQFLFLGLFFLIVGGLLALVVRWQLAWPNANIPGGYKPVPVLSTLLWGGTAEHPAPMPSEWYNQAFTMHASIMIFLVIIPLLVGTFGNYLIPLKIGAPDMCFPYLNGAAFWLAVPAGMLLVASFLFPGGPAQAGWTSYPTLSELWSNKKLVELDPPQRTPPKAKAESAAWFYADSVAHFLRNKTHGAALTKKRDELKDPAIASEFVGDADVLRQAIQDAAVSVGAKAELADGKVVVADAAGAKATYTLAGIDVERGTLSYAGDTGVHEQVMKALKEKVLPSRLATQSPWSTMGIFSVSLGLLLMCLYLFSYPVQLGFRPLNWAVAGVLAVAGAWGLLKLFQFLAFDGQSAWFFAIFLLGFSSILGAVNYLTTIVKLRAPGMTFFRMPLSVWSLFVTALIVLLGTPVLAAALFMNLMDHHRFTTFFIPFNWVVAGQEGAAGGGFPILHQHLFWFYSHPAVYIMILPAMGMVSDIMAVFSRKPIFGYRPMIYAMGAIGFLGFIVWAHHMFQSGMNPSLGTTFAVSTMLIAVPSAIKTFNWLGTLWRGNIQFTTPMLHAITFVAMFVIGGLSGIFMASTAVDVFIHDTYFIVAHIHYVLFGGSLFGLFAAITFWYPKMFGRMMGEWTGKLHWFLTFVTFNCTFFPMHILGMRGMSRRVADYTSFSSFADLLAMNQFITYSALAMGAVQVLFVLNFVGSWVFGKKAGRNPWNATTLEWETASPPPHGNFETTPVVYHGPYEYSSPLVEEDWLAQTRKVEDGPAPALAVAAAH